MSPEGSSLGPLRGIILGIEFPSGRFGSERMLSLGLVAGISWPTEHRVWSLVGRRLIGRCTRWLVDMLSLCEKMQNEQLLNGGNYSRRMHQIHGSGGLPLRRRSLVRALFATIGRQGT